MALINTYIVQHVFICRASFALDFVKLIRPKLERFSFSETFTKQCSAYFVSFGLKFSNKWMNLSFYILYNAVAGSNTAA